MAHAILRDN